MTEVILNSLIDPARPQLQIAHAKMTKKLKKRRMPMIFIGIPVLFSIIYCFLLAPNFYYSESRFAIRQPDASAGMGGGKGGGGLLAGLAGAGLVFDGFALRDFIQSQDAMNQLDESTGFFARTVGIGYDPLYRLSPNADADARLAFYRRLVGARFSITEQILVLDVWAFSPDDARAISEGIIKISEDFANRSNERSRRDSLALAQKELELAEKRAMAARLAINDWRIANGNIDPQQSIQMVQAVVAQLQQTASQTQAEISSLTPQIDSQSARRRQLEARLTALNEQIQNEQAKLTGGPRSVTNLLREYERLTIEIDFANRQIASAQDSLEQARIAMTRQTKYISIISNPTISTQPGYPNPLKIVPMVLVLSALAYGIVSMILAMVRETHG